MYIVVEFVDVYLIIGCKVYKKKKKWYFVWLNLDNNKIIFKF